ncbi:MAG: DUF3291 domain-containing protein, partial [Alphaproteobacteria bacterium]|nr:DUF3291 domain-containing protein [Alphaproteobacteria bacterium]
LAENSPGFVWRLKGDSGNASDTRIDDPAVLVNRTVWQTINALFYFVYQTAHAQVMARRREWFEKPTQPYQVLSWIAADHIPSLDEAMARQGALRDCGPTPAAFSFKVRYPMLDLAGGATDMRPGSYRVGLK